MMIFTQDNIKYIIQFEFTEDQARDALNQTDNNLHRALDLILRQGGKYIKKSKKKNIKKRINKSKKKIFNISLLFGYILKIYKI